MTTTRTKTITSVGLIVFLCASMRSHASSRDEDHSYLMSLAKSTDPNSRVNGGNILWKTFLGDREFVLDLMENDRNFDVRRRLALIVVQNGGHPRAIRVLQGILADSDISTHHGAERALSAAEGLEYATKRPHGLRIATAILTAPTTWFSDARTSKHGESLLGTLKLRAASNLLSRPVGKSDAASEHALDRLFEEASRSLKDGPPREREFWKGRLPGLFETCARAGRRDLIGRHMGIAEFLDDPHAKERVRHAVGSPDKPIK